MPIFCHRDLKLKFENIQKLETEQREHRLK